MKVLKFAVLATAATAIGWAIGCLAYIVTMGRMFDQVPLEDDHWWTDIVRHHKRWRDINGPLSDLEEWE